MGAKTVVHVAEKSCHCISSIERFALTTFISRVVGHETPRLPSQFSEGGDTREEHSVLLSEQRCSFVN